MRNNNKLHKTVCKITPETPQNVLENKFASHTSHESEFTLCTLHIALIYRETLAR